MRGASRAYALMFYSPLTPVPYFLLPGLRAISLRELHTSELYVHCRTAANPDFIASALPPYWLIAAYQLADLGRLEQAAAYMAQVIGAVEISGPGAWSPAFLAHANTLRQLLKARRREDSRREDSRREDSRREDSRSRVSMAIVTRLASCSTRAALLLASLLLASLLLASLPLTNRFTNRVSHLLASLTYSPASPTREPYLLARRAASTRRPATRRNSKPWRRRTPPRRRR